MPPVEAAIPTTIDVRFWRVSAITLTFSSAFIVPFARATTSFQNTLAPNAIPTELLDDAAIVPVRSVMVVLSSAVTSTDWVVDAVFKLALSLISTP